MTGDAGMCAEPHKGRATLASCRAASRLLERAVAEPSPHAEMTLLSTALLTMQEMERRRIAAELHDSIGQSLSAVCFGIGVAMDGLRKGNVQSAGELLEKLAAHVKEAIGEVQRIAMDLRPPMLDEVGLVGTLTSFINEFRSIHAGLSVTADLQVAEHEVAPELRNHVLRLLQEALSNVARHSRATDVHVRLRRVKNEIQLEVADNGTGFILHDAGRGPADGPGFGLRGMRERADVSGGRICVESVPGQGARVFVAWPMPVPIQAR